MLESSHAPSDPPSAPEDDRSQQLRFVRRVFGTRLIQSATEAELDDRIQGLLDDELFSDQLVNVVRGWSADELASLSTTASPGFAARFRDRGLPTPAALVAGDTIDDALARALAKLIATLTAEGVALHAQSFEGFRAQDVLRDPSIAPELIPAILCLHRALVCVIGLRLLAEDPTLLQRSAMQEQALVEAIARRWAQNSWEVLRLLASIPELSVSEELVPLSARLDLSALQVRPRWTVGSGSSEVIPGLHGAWTSSAPKVDNGDEAARARGVSLRRQLHEMGLTDDEILADEPIEVTHAEMGAWLKGQAPCPMDR